MFFYFWNCYFLADKLRHKLGAKKLKIGDFMYPFRRADKGYLKTEIGLEIQPSGTWRSI
jgi:hypothetical protein